MPDVWKHWAGQTVDGNFPLQSYLGGSDYSAVFLTVRRTDRGPEKAAIKLIPASPETSERRLERWRLAAGLTHRHLIPLHEMGRTEMGGFPLLYLVTEYAEENLGQVLAVRALTPAEARSMLAPLVDVLGYLHGKGLVHGHIKPNNIMANGDRLMISSDAIRRAGEPCDDPGRPDAYDAPETARGVIPGTAAMEPAGDVWSLGVMLVEALTQKLPATPPGGTGDPVLPPGLPEPLAEIARHTVARHPQSRWTAAQIAMRLEGRAPARAAAAGATAGQKAQAAPARASATASGGEPMRAPARPAPGAVAQQAAQAPAQPGKPRLRRYLYVLPVLAGLILAAALTVPKLMRPEQSEAPQASPAAVSPAATALPGPANQATPEIPAAAGNQVAQDATAEAAPPAGRMLPGEVAQQVLPRIPQSASDTVTGTVLVVVGVDVDAMGKVTHAELEVPGPSKYFARKSMEAAPEWTFVPPQANGRPVASRWRISFGYTNQGPHASAKRASP